MVPRHSALHAWLTTQLPTSHLLQRVQLYKFFFSNFSKSILINFVESKVWERCNFPSLQPKTFDSRPLVPPWATATATVGESATGEAVRDRGFVLSITQAVLCCAMRPIAPRIEGSNQSRCLGDWCVLTVLRLTRRAMLVAGDEHRSSRSQSQVRRWRLLLRSDGLSDVSIVYTETAHTHYGAVALTCMCAGWPI